MFVVVVTVVVVVAVVNVHYTAIFFQMFASKWCVCVCAK